jgi:hypothetical protein
LEEIFFLALYIKIITKTPYILAVILNLPETSIIKNTALALFIGIVKAISYSIIYIIEYIIYFIPVLVLLLIKIKIGIIQIALKGLLYLLEERRNIRVYKSNPNFSTNNSSYNKREEEENTKRLSALL